MRKQAEAELGQAQPELGLFVETCLNKVNTVRFKAKYVFFMLKYECLTLCLWNEGCIMA